MDQSTWQRVYRTARPALFAILLLAMAFCFDGTVAGQAPTQQSEEMKPAEQVFKNIQVLKGMPAAELQGTMSFIASSLDVDCDYCHRQDKEGTFASDAAPQKSRAREMILMVRRINQETFQGQNAVNCFTCHRGSTAPVSISPISVLPLRPEDKVSAANSPAPSLPTVDQVLDRYVKALGGQAALDAVTSRVIKTAPLGQANSPSSMNELFQKAPGKAMVLHQSEGYTLWAGFNGQQAWSEDSLKSYWGILNTSELHALMRDAEMYPGSRIRTQYRDVAVKGTEQIGDRNTIVIAGTSPEGTREKFYFDARSGLLLRRHIEERTTFGWFPVEVNFEAYREVDGVKIPFVVRFSSAGGAWGVRTSYVILEVRQNVPIEDEKFDGPPLRP